MKCETVGDGPAQALLVHGNDLCGPFYRRLGRELAGYGFATRLITLPGFHDQPPLAAPGWAGLAEAVADALPAPDTLLIGHSMGGLVALLAAARRPPALGRLVLMEPAIFPYRWLARAAARRYLRTVVRGDREGFVNWNGGMLRISRPAEYPTDALELYLEVRRTSDRRTGETLFRTLPGLYPLPYARIQVPLLLVSGADSGWQARLLRQPLRRRLRPERVVSIPGGAHWLANEQDAAVARAIAGFAAPSASG